MIPNFDVYDVDSDSVLFGHAKISPKHVAKGIEDIYPQFNDIHRDNYMDLILHLSPPFLESSWVKGFRRSA